MLMAMRQKTAFFHRREVVPWVFLSPFLLLFVIFKVYPVIYALYLSFVKIATLNSPPIFVGMTNYTDLLSDASFFKSLRIAFFYAGGDLLILICIPLILAALLQSGWVRGATFHRGILFLPALTSLVVATIVVRWMLQQQGIVNAFLGLFGVPSIGWVEAGIYAVPICILITLWRWTGMNIVYFQSGLNNIPKELFEAAAIDGASPMEAFYNVALPLLRPIIIFVATITLIAGFQVFVEPYVLYNGGAGPGQNALTMSLYLYRVAFQNGSFGYASAIGMVLAIIIMIFTLVQLKFFGFFSGEE
jgi:arabinosaccharide transport system permease protein